MRKKLADSEYKSSHILRPTMSDSGCVGHPGRMMYEKKGSCPRILTSHGGLVIRTNIPSTWYMNNWGCWTTAYENSGIADCVDFLNSISWLIHIAAALTSLFNCYRFLKRWLGFVTDREEFLINLLCAAIMMWIRLGRTGDLIDFLINYVCWNYYASAFCSEYYQCVANEDPDGWVAKNLGDLLECCEDKWGIMRYPGGGDPWEIGNNILAECWDEVHDPIWGILHGV